MKYNMANRKITVTAHAGAMNTRANSVSSVKQIVQTAADIVEFDVSFRPDGTPVAIHKDRPSIRQGTLLSKMLAAVAESETMQINLDLKSETNLPALMPLIREFGLLKRVFFTGVERERALKVREQCPEIPYYLNTSLEKKNDSEYLRTLAREIRMLGCVGINMHYSNATQLAVDIMHEEGLLVSLWTVGKAADMQRLLNYGADNITTRKPLKLLRLIDNH